MARARIARSQRASARVGAEDVTECPVAVVKSTPASLAAVTKDASAAAVTKTATAGATKDLIPRTPASPQQVLSPCAAACDEHVSARYDSIFSK
jgi:hypothetical protein